MSSPDLPHAPFVWIDVRSVRDAGPRCHAPEWLFCRTTLPAALAAGYDYVVYDAAFPDWVLTYGRADDIDRCLHPAVRARLDDPSAPLRRFESPEGPLRALTFAEALAIVHVEPKD